MRFSLTHTHGEDPCSYIIETLHTYVHRSIFVSSSHLLVARVLDRRPMLRLPPAPYRHHPPLRVSPCATPNCTLYRSDDSLDRGLVVVVAAAAAAAVICLGLSRVSCARLHWIALACKQ